MSWLGLNNNSPIKTKLQVYKWFKLLYEYFAYRGENNLYREVDNEDVRGLAES